MIEQYLTNPELGLAVALEFTKKHVFSDENFKRQWDTLLPADRIILSMLANGDNDLHSKLAMQKLGEALGIGDSVDRNVPQNALKRMSNKNIITKIQYGMYQFEDEAFADWVKHLVE